MKLTQEQIEQGNELIATVLCGAIKNNSSSIIAEESYFTFKHFYIQNQHFLSLLADENSFWLSQLRFHDDYNWSMNLANSIGCPVYMKGSDIFIKKNNTISAKNAAKCVREEGYTPIESLFLALVRFAEWKLKNETNG